MGYIIILVTLIFRFEQRLQMQRRRLSLNRKINWYFVYYNESGVKINKIHYHHASSMSILQQTNQTFQVHQRANMRKRVVFIYDLKHYNFQQYLRSLALKCSSRRVLSNGICIVMLNQINPRKPIPFLMRQRPFNEPLRECQ
jgi:hypothetical protein